MTSFIYYEWAVRSSSGSSGLFVLAGARTQWSEDFVQGLSPKAENAKNLVISWFIVGG